MNPMDMVGSWGSKHLHDFGVALSSDIDALMGVILIVLLFLRLFQWKKAGQAILPVFGVYFILKVVLP